MVSNYPEEFKYECFYFYEGGNGNEIVITREKKDTLGPKVEFMFCEDNTKHTRRVYYNSNGYYLVFKNKKYYVKNKTNSI